MSGAHLAFRHYLRCENSANRVLFITNHLCNLVLCQQLQLLPRQTRLVRATIWAANGKQRTDCLAHLKRLDPILQHDSSCFSAIILSSIAASPRSHVVSQFLYLRLQTYRSILNVALQTIRYTSIPSLCGKLIITFVRRAARVTTSQPFLEARHYLCVILSVGSEGLTGNGITDSKTS